MWLGIWKRFIHTDALDRKSDLVLGKGTHLRGGFWIHEFSKTQKCLGFLRWLQIKKKRGQIRSPENVLCKMLRVAEFSPWPHHQCFLCRSQGPLESLVLCYPQNCLSPPRLQWLHASGVYVHPVNPAMQPFQEMLVGGGVRKLSLGLVFEGLITTAWHTAAQSYGTCPQ